MMRLLPTCFLVLFILSGHAQNSIKGRVIDSTQAPVPFCPMALMQLKDSSQVKGNISDSLGNYFFEKIKPGRYFIRFSAVGFRTVNTGSFVVDSSATVEVPVMTLSNSGVNLAEVSVAVLKPAIEFKKGIVVLNVEDDLIAKGNTVFDLLKRLPGVMIDAQNNLTINGQSGARFMIDERMQQMPTPQVLDMLMGMSADAVVKVELIKNPPARYDAAGSGGLINIVTKKQKVNGYNGNAGFGASQGIRARWGPSGAFNYKAGRLSIFSNFSYGHWDMLERTTMNRHIVAGDHTEQIDTYGNNPSYQRVFSGSAGLEYDLDKKTVLGVYVNGNRNNDIYDSHKDVSVNNSTFFNYQKSTSETHTDYFAISPNYNVSLIRKVDTTGGQLKLRLGYNTYVERQRDYMNNRFYDAIDVEVTNPATYERSGNRTFNVYTGKLDYNKTFKNKIELESGLGANLEDDNMDQKLQFSNQSTGFFVGDTLFYNKYRFRQDVLAAYSTLARNWDKFGFSIGLRAEQTNVNVDFKSSKYHYRRNYTSLFPSASVDYNLNKKNTFTLSYSRRIRRPFYGMLNPVRQYNDQLNYNVGNPEIRPQFSNQLNLDYNFNHFINVSAGYDLTKDFTFWYSYTPGNSRVQIDTVSNLPKFTNTYLSLTAQKRVKWYNFQTYVGLWHQTFEGSLIGQDVSSRTTQLYFNLNQEFYLPKDWKIQVWSGRGSAIRHGPQVYLPRSAVHISVSKSFLKQKLNITLTLADAMYRDYFRYTTEYTGQGFYLLEKQDSRRVRIIVNYRFGKMQFQQKVAAEGSTINTGR